MESLFILPATRKELKKQYKALALKYHPDKSKDPEANIKFVQLKNTYERLLNTGGYTSGYIFGNPGETFDVHNGSNGTSNGSVGVPEDLKSKLPYRKWVDLLLFINRIVYSVCFTNDLFHTLNIEKYFNNLEINNLSDGYTIIYFKMSTSDEGVDESIEIAEAPKVPKKYTHHGFITEDQNNKYLYIYFAVDVSREKVLEQINKVMELIHKYDDRKLFYFIEEKETN